MRVTRHAEERSRERLGVKKGAVNRLAQRALSFGLKHKQTTGRLREYCDSMYLRYQKADNMRIYGRFLYLFCQDTLITVVHLPKAIIKLVDNHEPRT